MTINNVAIYLRKSRAEDGLTDAESLENHRNVLTEIAERNSWKYEIFEEIGSSMSISERPQLRILLDSVTNKYIYDAVLVMDVDRLSRDRYDSSLIMKILRDNDVKIVTADGKITNLRDENDALMTDFKDIFSNYEYKQITKRMIRGKEASARKGRWSSGRVPLGYVYNKDTGMLDIDEDKAPIIREIFHMYANGTGTHFISLEMNKRGYRGAMGKPFGGKSIRDIITNEIYLGNATLRKFIKAGNTYKLRPEEEHIRHEGIYPAIVEKELFESVQRRYESQKMKPNRAKAGTHSLSGLVRCGYCDKVHAIQTRPTKGKVLKGCSKRDLITGVLCRNHGILYEKIMEDVFKDLSKHSATIDETVERLTKDKTMYLNSKDRELAALESQLKTIEAQLKRINYMFMNDLLSEEELGEMKPQKVKEKEHILKRITEVKELTVDDKLEEYEKVSKTLKNILDNRDVLSDKDLNRLLSSVINRIVLYNYKDKDVKPRIVIEFK